MIDTSGSQERTLPDEKIAARAFVDTVIRDRKDEVAVLRSPARRRSNRDNGHAARAARH